MIRLTALWVAAAVVGIYTWKDWFKGLCGIVLLLGILEYPDVPRTMFGVPGLNFFNLLIMNVLVAWAAQRQREELRWDLPPYLTGLLILYLGVILVGWIRLVREPTYIEESTLTLINDDLINTVKWTIPGLLFFEGCRSRERLRYATFAFLGALVFLGVMTIKVMPIGSPLLSGEELQRLALKLTVSRLGYHRVTLSMMLAGAFWALIAARPLVADAWVRRAMVLTAILVLYGQTLTGGRGGYVTWGALALIMAILKWRKIFLALPIVVVAVIMFMPAVTQRIMAGFTSGPYSSETTFNEDEASAGRTVMWPYVIEKIKRRPIIGYGREAMTRTGTATYLYFLGEDFGHPHNMYLEWLLDNGVVGFIPVITFYFVILFHALRLFLEKHSMVCTVAGGVALVMVLALMVAGITSQSFYPVPATTEMWCAIGLMLRVSVERKRAMAILKESAVSVRHAAFGFMAPIESVACSLDELIWPRDVKNSQRRPGMRIPQTLPPSPLEPCLATVGAPDDSRRERFQFL